MSTRNAASIKYFLEEREDLHFVVATHDPKGNGNATAADSDPTYAVYELQNDGTVNNLTSGTMSQFDSGTITSQYHVHVSVSNDINNWDRKRPLLFVVEATVNSVSNIAHLIIDQEEEAALTS